MGPARVASTGDRKCRLADGSYRAKGGAVLSSCDPSAAWSVPHRLPILEPGAHRPSDGRMSVLEAASWLAGEGWSDHPCSVHPSVAHVMANAGAYPEPATAELWPLILASVGTARGRPRPLMWIRGLRARLHLRRDPRIWLRAWHAIVDRHIVRRPPTRCSSRTGSKPCSTERRVTRTPSPRTRQPRTDAWIWIDTFRN